MKNLNQLNIISVFTLYLNNIRKQTQKNTVFVQLYQQVLITAKQKQIKTKKNIEEVFN